MSELIRVTDVVEHVFCPKFTYFNHVLGIPQYEEKRGTVKAGRELHQRRASSNPGYFPVKFTKGLKKIEATLYSERLGLVGKVDSAIISDNEILIAENKHSRPFVGPTLLTQLGLLAVLLEENYGKKCVAATVNFSSDESEKRQIQIDAKVKSDALRRLADAKNVLASGIMPYSEYSARCDDCCYRRICPVGCLKTSQ